MIPNKPLYKDVSRPEFAEFYQVSSDGRVISKRSGKEMSASPNTQGYLQVKLSTPGYSRNVTVHRLVAEAFIPREHSGLQVDHIDNDKLNNNMDNLQWLTGSQNVKKAFDQGRIHPTKGKIKGKIRGYYISNENIESMEKAGVNKSKLINDLLTTHFQITPSPKNTEPIKVEDMHSNMGSPSAKIAVEPSAVVDDLFNAHTPRSEANPSEFPCCANEIQPCKHWVWDINLAVWKNSLSGRLMEAE